MTNPSSSTNRPKRTAPQPGLRKKHPTIGLLTEGLSGQYQAGVWPGIVDAAKLYNVNIICFCGGSLKVSAENPWDYQGNVLFKIAQVYPLDGLIIAGSVGCYVTDTTFNEFLASYSHLKIVTIVPAVESLPAVYGDNLGGMRSLVNHLVECHPYRKIAFIKGPDRNIEAEERLKVFREVLAEHDIPVDPYRILPGDFTRNCGFAAVEQLISSCTEFDAIVAANDESALGALESLQERGIRVPEEVALVGFDDIDESRFVTPPLTSVHQPLYDLGKLAVEKLLLLLKGEDIPKNNIAEAKLVIRQSCGCFKNSANSIAHHSPDVHSAVPLALVEKTVAMNCAAGVDPAYAKEVKNIISSFCYDVNNRTDESFLRTVDRIGHALFLQKREEQVLITLFHRLWQYVFTQLDRPAFAFADELLHRAFLLCGSLGTRKQGIWRIHSVRKNTFLREIGDALNNTLDIDRLIDAIDHYLPKTGINSFILSMYERPNLALSGKSRLKYALINGKRKKIDTSKTVFDTRTLLPPETISDDVVYVLVAEALYFQNEQFGIALFEAGLQECEHYHVLKEYISGALHSAALIRKVRHQAEVLAAANDELKKLREEEHAYLQAVKRELDLGRKIQMGFLPHQLPQVPGFEIAAAFEPAREVSGDFYDAFTLGNDQVALVIADVSGKDVGAALFMSLIRTLIRVFAERSETTGDDPLDAVKVVNDYILNNHLPSEGYGNMYATIIFGILRPSTGEFRYVNAGHIAPMIVDSRNEITTLVPTAMAVGLAAQVRFEQDKATINPGDLFFLYTDGVTEAKDPQGDFFTKERLRKLLGTESATAGEKVNQISAALRNHNAGAAPFDDITMLAVKRAL